MMYLFLNVEVLPIYMKVCFLTKCRTGLLICNPIVQCRVNSPLSSYNSTKNRLLCKVKKTV